MALLTISEPSGRSNSHGGSIEAAIGIDLGTTHSLVAGFKVVAGSKAVRAQILVDQAGREKVPSVVTRCDNRWLVGEDALTQLAVKPGQVFASVKRFMGKSSAQVQAQLKSHPSAYEWNFDEPRVPKVGVVEACGQSTWLSVVELSAKILEHLVRQARQALGPDARVDSAVITVPAYFDDAQRQATKDAARLAGLKVKRLINEPTAAALAYGLEKQQPGLYAVYDLGGGTFDISILRLDAGVFEVIATGGDTYLGGDDMDQAIAVWFADQCDLELTQVEWVELRQQARQAKECLSSQKTVQLTFAHRGRTHQQWLSVETFETLIAPWVERTLACCKQVLIDANVRVNQIHKAVMVGGATRVGLVRQAVGEFFGCELSLDLNPDTIVALGAASQARQLTHQDQGVLLLDVTPLSLGLETMGGLVEKIIPRNTPIPVTRKQTFTTFKDGQTAMSLHLVQGERELVKDNRSLAQFELKGFKPMVAGAAKVEVSFSVDADGLLSVSAHETQSDVRAEVQVKPSHGLTEQDMQAMLEASADYAETDVAQRVLAERQVDADRLLVTLEAALAADSALLDEVERAGLDTAMQALARARDHSKDYQQIVEAIDQVNQVADVFAQRRMNASIRRALKGKTIDQLSE